jgi:hypothetical protein
MCGTKSNFALSGLIDFFGTLTRGVAPGWFVVAPSVLKRMLFRGCSHPVLAVIAILFFLDGIALLAANSPLADAVEKQNRDAIRQLLKKNVLTHCVAGSPR